MNAPELRKVGSVKPLLSSLAIHITNGKASDITVTSSQTGQTALLPHLTDNIQLAERLHSFQKGRSTLTALNIITHAISTGLNKPEICDRAMLVSLDLVATFDTAHITTLLQDFLASAVHVGVKRCLTAYLRF